VAFTFRRVQFLYLSCSLRITPDLKRRPFRVIGRFNDPPGVTAQRVVFISVACCSGLRCGYLAASA
jgi:hypothetical protein